MVPSVEALEPLPPLPWQLLWPLLWSPVLVRPPVGWRPKTWLLLVSLLPTRQAVWLQSSCASPLRAPPAWLLVVSPPARPMLVAWLPAVVLPVASSPVVWPHVLLALPLHAGCMRLESLLSTWLLAPLLLRIQPPSLQHPSGSSSPVWRSVMRALLAQRRLELMLALYLHQPGLPLDL